MHVAQECAAVLGQRHASNKDFGFMTPPPCAALAAVVLSREQDDFRPNSPKI
jgi:hypothetical protein